MDKVFQGWDQADGAASKSCCIVVTPGTTIVYIPLRLVSFPFKVF